MSKTEEQVKPGGLTRVADNNFDKLQARKGLTLANNSQMSKISQYAVSDEKIERENASMRAALEQKERRLTKVHAYLVKLKHRFSLLSIAPLKDKKEGLVKIHGNLVTLIEHPNLPHGLSKSLQRTLNEVVSIRESLSQSKKIQASTVIESTMLDQAIELAAKLCAISQFKIEAYGTRGDVARKEEYEDQLMEKARDIIKNSNKESKRLEAIKNKPVVLDRVPIVPVVDGILRSEVLNRKGLKTENLGGYVLIHSQMVLGINKEVLAKKGRKQEKAADAAKRYLDSFSKSTGKQLAFVSEQPTPYGGGLWFWVAEERVINALSAAANNKFKLRYWGFGMGTSESGVTKGEV